MLNTEKRNPNTYHLSDMSSYDIVKTINQENAQVSVAIEKALPDIAKACDAVAAAIENGGRVFYMGAGTSGRLGVCDAAECPLPSVCHRSCSWASSQAVPTVCSVLRKIRKTIRSFPSGI